jgi:excisionase family DNA binding protein
MIKYEDESYLTTNEASKYMGKTVTAFRQFIARNTISRRKLGGRLYFPLKELDGYFAKRSGDRYEHFESRGISYNEVMTIDQLQTSMMTTKQNLYHFLNKNNIQRYKDNANRTLFNRAQIDALLGKFLHPNVDDL